ncbi:MAG: hypothetical protein KC442_23905, partial [Thermomicrobiales bacterium]|nr:hypothetical protein [Thermomicrobiales bacterium]
GACVPCNVLCAGTAGECGAALQAAFGGSEPTLYVCPGTYAGGFTIARGVTVVGAGTGQTVLDGTDTQRVLAITANVPVTLQALTITRGAEAADSSGAGISNQGNLTLIDAAVSDNHMTYSDSFSGAGIYSSNALTLRNTLVSKNTSARFGGGVFLWGSSLTLEPGSSIEENDGGWGAGGVYSSQGGITLKAGSRIFKNTTTGPGGGIYNGDGWIVMEDGSRIEENTARSCAGIRNDGGGVTLLSGSQVVKNGATNYGGGIYTRSSGQIILKANSWVAYNTAGNAGGGLFSEGGLVTIEEGAVICLNTDPQCAMPHGETSAFDGACPFPENNVCPD